MTCISGVVGKNGKVWIGGDSAGVTDEDLSLEVRDDEKVFRVGEFLYGFCGSFRTRDLVRYAFVPKKQGTKQTELEYLVTTFVADLREVLIKGGMKQEDNLIDMESAFLLGYHSQLYKIEDDFQVGRISAGFTAVGCGAAIALGALDVTPNKPPGLRIRHALEAAEHWSAGVRGPFTVLSI